MATVQPPIIPPGMHNGSHGFAFNSIEFHEAGDSYKAAPIAYLRQLLVSESWTPAQVQVLADKDDESVDLAVRCWEVGPKRALPLKWCYDRNTGILLRPLWTHYDVWEASEKHLLRDSPPDETLVRDMEQWFQGCWRCKPF